MLQISYEKVFRHPKSNPRPLAEGIGAWGSSVPEVSDTPEGFQFVFSGCRGKSQDRTWPWIACEDCGEHSWLCRWPSGVKTQSLFGDIFFRKGGIGWGNLSQIIWDFGFRNYNFSFMRRVCDILLSTAGKDSERVRWGLKWWNTTRPSRCWMVSCKWHSRFMVSIPNLNFSIFQPSKGSSAPMQVTSLVKR